MNAYVYEFYESRLVYLMYVGMRVGFHKECKLKNARSTYNKINGSILQADDKIKNYGDHQPSLKKCLYLCVRHKVQVRKSLYRWYAYNVWVIVSCSNYFRRKWWPSTLPGVWIYLYVCQGIHKWKLVCYQCACNTYLFTWQVCLCSCRGMHGWKLMCYRHVCRLYLAMVQHPRIKTRGNDFPTQSHPCKMETICRKVSWVHRITLYLL